MKGNKTMTLYQYLIDEKQYTEAEAEETVIRYDIGMEIPEEIIKDIREYNRNYY